MWTEWVKEAEEVEGEEAQEEGQVEEEQLAADPIAGPCSPD